MKFFKDNDQLIECIPNFSEGRDKKVIQLIANAIESVDDVRLLHRDIGYDANRTVFTFAGKPQAVIEAAFKAIKTATENIDMSKQVGEHPRMGAIDVCPLVPLRNISMEEVIDCSKQLGEKVGKELSIPVFLYEKSATQIERSNLAFLRKGEYEGIEKKFEDQNWKPDYGPFEFNKKSGITAIGVRDFLIAYNINLNTKDVGIAKQIASQIRESGFVKKGIRKHGQFKGLKAIGWYMDEYNCAQVSTNIVDVNSAPIHLVFEAIKSMANEFGIEVNGSELIGLIPEEILLNAGQFYSSTTFHNNDKKSLINLSINNLGLNTLSNFTSKGRILEYLL